VNTGAGLGDATLGLLAGSRSAVITSMFMDYAAALRKVSISHSQAMIWF
jgi:hypothetical protein